MKYDVRVLAAADADAADIFIYVAQENRDAAIRLLDKMHAAMKSLEENPERGARIKSKVFSKLEFRFLVVESYLIFYKIMDHEVHVHHIVHQRRNPVSILLGNPKAEEQ